MDRTTILFIVGVMMLFITIIFISLLYRFNREYKEYKAAVINLARRRDRMILFSQHYHFPIKYEIVDAVDGKTVNAEDLLKKKILGEAGWQSLVDTHKGVPKKYHYELGSIGAVGCSLSHIKIWKKMVRENTPYMFVFEDDAWVFGIDMDDIISRLSDLPEDWHIYMVGQPHSILEGIPVPNKNHLYRLTRFCGTHAYLINLEGAKWLLSERGRLFPIQQQIDAHLSELGWDHGLNIYMHLKMPLIGSFGANSDIQVNSNTATWARYKLT